MSEVIIATFGNWYGQLFQMYQNQQYAEALEIATREGDRYPNNQPIIYHFRACMNACMGDAPAALRVLEAAHQAGYWYNAPFWDDADFNAIHDDPEFLRLRELSEARAAEAQANAKPELTVVKPQTDSPYPVLIALHGNNSTMDQQGDQWRSAAASGWLVGLAQSSQIVSPTGFVWNDAATADQEIKAHYEAMIAQHSGDQSRVVLSGFSMGGETAVRQACTGLIPSRGFIAIAPGGPLTGQTPDDWEPILAQGKSRGIRGYMIIGKQDNGYEAIKALVARIQAAGIPLQIEEHDNLAHEFPSDFSVRLPEMLAFVLGE